MYTEEHDLHEPRKPKPPKPCHTSHHTENTVTIVRSQEADVVKGMVVRMCVCSRLCLQYARVKCHPDSHVQQLPVRAS